MAVWGKFTAEAPKIPKMSSGQVTDSQPAVGEEEEYIFVEHGSRALLYVWLHD